MAKVERWVCDKCGRPSNGLGADGWIALDKILGVSALVARPLTVALRTVIPIQTEDNAQQHFCGMECALSAIAEDLRVMAPKK